MITHISTTDENTVQPFLKNIFIPQSDSHKGQNGRVLIIGGSELFHAASLWAAEASSFFVDMVHYSSTVQNNEIFLSLKKKFRNGIVVPREHIPDYIAEDDAILIGPGMVRGERSEKCRVKSGKFEEILTLEEEFEFTQELVHYVINKFPEKKYVLDAGALQMMDPIWLLGLKEKPILTPHQLEFERIFGTSLTNLNFDEKVSQVQEMAKKYSCVIMLKAITDIISDGKDVWVVEGGNQGLTKGGSGDILAGLATSFFAKTDAVTAAVLASYLVKKTSEVLFEKTGYWFNMSTLLEVVPSTLHQLLSKGEYYSS